MRAYLLSFVTAALCIAVAGVLTPSGGIGKYVRVLCALFLITVIASPLGGLFDGLRALVNGDWRLPTWEEESDPSQSLQDTLNEASKSYFSESLTHLLEEEFSIKQGEIECRTVWSTDAEQITPKSIRLLLSGSAVWKDPKAIEAYVVDLLQCECIIAIK